MEHSEKMHTDHLPPPLSLQHAHFRWPSNNAITWPQVPLFCPGEDMMISKLANNVDIKYRVQLKVSL